MNRLVIPTSVKSDTVAFSQASEIYPPDASLDSRERDLAAPLPMPGFDIAVTAPGQLVYEKAFCPFIGLL
jgi:hypothetical protein